MSKDDFWKEVALKPTGVAAGTYSIPQLTIDEDGRIVSASGGTVSTISTEATIAGLPNIVAPSNGDLAAVMDDGAGNEQLYIWNDANADIGAPLNKWRLIGSTESQVTRKDYRQLAIDISAIQDIGPVIPDTGIIKRVTVEITTPYSLGATIEIQDAGAFVYMPFTSINPQLAAIYSEDLSGNLDNMATNGSGQIRAIVGGAPVAGAGVVYVEWIDV